MNNGEIAYNDIHLSQMAQEVRYGFMGKVNVAIIEACEVTPDGKIYLTAAGGIAPTVCRLADQIIVELNAAHSKSAMGLHDVYEPLDPPYRREIPIYKPLMKVADLDRIYLRAYFTSDQLSELELGQAVTVTADFGGDRQVDYPGRITWIASESEFTPKTIQTRSSRASLVYAVKIAVENDGRLKIGLYGEVKL